MKGKIILIVDGDEEQRTIAKRLIFNLGGFPIVANNLGFAKHLLKEAKGVFFGVITGIHFPTDEDTDDPSAMNGLKLAKFAVHHGLRVAICSHSQGYFYEKELEETRNSHKCVGNVIPFSDAKDWEHSVQQLLKIEA